ncbi:MAG TPA: hypothetical protein VIW45_18385 [Vicinamibacterales bacterium]
MAPGSWTRIVKTFSVEYPGSTRPIARKLRSSSPAPTSRTTASATSEITNA